MPSIQQAKAQLDKIIGKARTQFYKPTQIAEVLYHSRTSPDDIDISEPGTYRLRSKNWRDEVSRELVGRASGSSSVYQDNVFEGNAMPPEMLSVLDIENREYTGSVEKYIYLRFERVKAAVDQLFAYIDRASRETFSLRHVLDAFDQPELRHSVDKIYEIVVYALFSTIVDHLNATVTLAVDDRKREALEEFSAFTEIVLGITPERPSVTHPARLYRAGVANAADKGLDMWANFGPAVQVKHIHLTAKGATRAAEEVTADHLIIVCKDIHRKVVQAIAEQLLGAHVRGVITESDLLEWYEKCLRGRFGLEMGGTLLRYLQESLVGEFVHINPEADEEEENRFTNFFRRRGYDTLEVPALWSLATATVQRTEDELDV